MKRLSAALALVLLGRAVAVAVNPLEKALELLAGLEQQVIKEGEASQKIFNEISEACEDRSRELHYEIKQSKAQGQELRAVIDAEQATTLALTQKIQDLGGAIAENEAELKASVELRNQEAATFRAKEKELLETLDALKRATTILERAGPGPSLVQLKGAGGLVQAFQAVVQATAVSDADASQLTALLQSASTEADAEGEEDEAFGAPSAAAYEGKSGAVTDALDGLAEKAEDQLEAARKAETNDMHNFEMKKQALEDELQQQKKDMASAKQLLAAAQEKEATASGDLTVSAQDLQEDQKVLAELHHDCMAKAGAFQEETKSRGEELTALATAKKVLRESTGGAEKKVYAQLQEAGADEDGASEAPAFVQASSSSASALQRAVHLVRRLAAAAASTRSSDSAQALAQLAARAAAAAHEQSAAGAAGPFDKVRGMIEDMVAKLSGEADKEAERKAYCDKEMAYTTEKKEDKEDEVASLSTKIEQMSSASVQLKEEVVRLNKELGALIKDQASIDKIRSEEKAIYEKVRPELEQGIEGVKAALQVLRDYYAQDGGQAASSSAAGAAGIIGALEVIESDFAKDLAEVVAEEERAVDEHAARTKENEVSRATKEADVKFKTQASASLDKATTESQADLASGNQELDAVMEYFTNIQKACTAKAEPYEERAAARAKEIQGLKEALEVLEGGASSLIQRRQSRRTLRGAGTLVPGL